MVEAAAEPAGLALESLLKFINISLEAWSISNQKDYPNWLSKWKHFATKEEGSVKVYIFSHFSHLGLPMYCFSYIEESCNIERSATHQ